MKVIRQKNRKNVDELISPILNLDIVNNYALGEGQEALNQNMFPVLPIKFDTSEHYF